MKIKKLNAQTFRVLCGVSLISSMMLSSGCSWLFGDQGYFRERTMDYQNAHEANPLRFPKGVESSRVVELYPIPHVKKQGRFAPETAEDIPRPQSILSVDEDLGIELRTDGSITWLLVEQNYDKLWATIADFLVASGMDISQQNKTAGKIETVWLKPRVQEEEGVWASFINLFTGDDKENIREKFLVSLEQEGSQQRYRVRIEHVTRIKGEAGLPKLSSEDWRQESENPELLDTLYAEVSDYIADEKSRRGHASIMAQNLTAMPSYLMTRDGNGYPVLMMQMDLNRAWIEVGSAIKKAKLVQNDLNLSLGIYYIAVDVEDEDEPQIYEIKLISAENGVQVAVQIDDDTVAPIEISDKLLIAISKQLG